MAMTAVVAVAIAMVAAMSAVVSAPTRRVPHRAHRKTVPLTLKACSRWRLLQLRWMQMATRKLWRTLAIAQVSKASSASPVSAVAVTVMAATAATAMKVTHRVNAVSRLRRATAVKTLLLPHLKLLVLNQIRPRPSQRGHKQLLNL